MITSIFPLVLHSYQVLLENRSVFESYFSNLFEALGVLNPFRVTNSLIFQQISGFEYLSHYQQSYPEIESLYRPYFKLYGSQKIKDFLQKLKNSMATWKLCLFQSHLIKQHQTILFEGVDQETLDLDWTTLISFASQKEGAEVGVNRKYKGKPCFQLSASFMGKVFVDAKLFAGHCNPKSFFQKAVRRVLSLGLHFDKVRADSAYCTIENLLFLNQLSLGYALGCSSSFTIVKEGIQRFKKLARQKHHSLLAIRKGVAAMDLGFQELAPGILTRVVIIRRIQRRKSRKTGKWKIKTYFYAIATSLEGSTRSVVEYYHKRQCIESGFRELKDHYHLERLPVKNLKGNEFWILTKIIAMTLVKLFQKLTLPKAWQTLMRKTLIRRLLHYLSWQDDTQKVVIPRKTARQWLLRRLAVKTQKIILAVSP